MRGVILCSLTDNDTCSQTRNHREGEAEPVLDTEQIQNRKGCTSNQYCADIRSQRERMQQILHGSAFFRTNQEDAE